MLQGDKANAPLSDWATGLFFMLDSSFDRIAKQYSLQRAYPPQIAIQVGSSIAAQLPPQATLLELGVGTGRIAFPVLAAGCQVVGIDISLEMLRAAQREGNSELLPRLSLVQGDITDLPFADGYFAGVVAVHVLHLVPNVRQTLTEARRVLGKNGVLLQGRDWTDPQSVAGQLRHQLRLAVMRLSPTARPPSAMVDIPALLRELGGSEAREVVAATWQSEVAPQTIIEGMAQRNDAETWALSDELLAAAVEEVRKAAIAAFHDLTTPQSVEHRFILTITSF